MPDKARLFLFITNGEMDMTWIHALYETYQREFRSRYQDAALTPEQFEDAFGAVLERLDKVETDGSAGRGVLFYRVWDEGSRQICAVPLFGYAASSDEVLTELFTRLSRTLVQRKSTVFQVHLYAHDTAAQRAFSMMQFGYMAETGSMALPLPSADSAFEIRTLTAGEITAHWAEIWAMTAGIVAHLQQAPVFYPGSEFTEEVYRDFFLDEATRLHAAFDERGNMVGMIETNDEAETLLSPAVRSVNVGEIYVVPERRGSGLSDALLRYAAVCEAERGAAFFWVEHGTANPQARRFWGRYFETYAYEMDRTVECF